MPTLASFAACVGDKETRIERKPDMLANVTTNKNSKPTEPRMMDGEEPVEVLLALVSSPLLALRRRGLAKIMTAKGKDGHSVVLAVFDKAQWDKTVGIISVLAIPEAK
jgi:hypothetical protein